MYMVMENYFIKWIGQIRRGYLELCIFALIIRLEKTYGFEIISTAETLGLSIKEGTLYPILNRMTKEGHLSANWDIQNVQGHPRKFYSITPQGRELFGRMKAEFEDMNETFHKACTIEKILTQPSKEEEQTEKPS